MQSDGKPVLKSLCYEKPRDQVFAYSIATLY